MKLSIKFIYGLLLSLFAVINAFAQESKHEIQWGVGYMLSGGDLKKNTLPFSYGANGFTLQAAYNRKFISGAGIGLRYQFSGLPFRLNDFASDYLQNNPSALSIEAQAGSFQFHSIGLSPFYDTYLNKNFSIRVFGVLGALLFQSPEIEAEISAEPNQTFRYTKGRSLSANWGIGLEPSYAFKANIRIFSQVAYMGSKPKISIEEGESISNQSLRLAQFNWSLGLIYKLGNR